MPTTMTTTTSNRVILLRKEKLDEIRHLVTERQLETWKNRVDKHSLSLICHHYYVGDLVLYQSYAKKGKPGDPWSDRWRGPAIIVKVTSKGKVDFRLPDGTVYKGWHSDRIKPFILRKDQ